MVNAWSLDTYVDYAVNNLLALASNIVTLLVVEVDDESRDEMDDDDDMQTPDADGSAAVAAADLQDADAATGNNADKKQKSVRLAAGLADDASTNPAKCRKT